MKILIHINNNYHKNNIQKFFSYFTSIDSQAWSLPTIESLLTLLDNYDSDVRNPEDHTSSEQAEEDDFLSKVMETRVMKKAYEFWCWK